MKESTLYRNIINFCRKEAVLVISGILAFASCVIVPPSAAYLDYVNYRVLALLFCLMTVVAGMKEAGAFRALCSALIQRVHQVRQIALLLVTLCFVLSMFLTNDVTLVTFVPFTILVFSELEDSDHDLLVTLIFETVAANLGSMLTPFGNPQNLYLFSEYGFGVGEFIGIMLPYTLLSLVLTLACTAFFCGRDQSGAALKVRSLGEESVRKRAFMFYFVLFMIALLAVARVLDYRVLLLITLVLVMLVDRRILSEVDYSLLLTFVFFFIFIGNLGSSQFARDMLARVMTGHEALTAILASQFVSNVPAALLLSGFTDNGRALVIGTNLGGLGTLIASMASLITYKLYAEACPDNRGTYLMRFTLVNVIFLFVLYAIYIFF